MHTTNQHDQHENEGQHSPKEILKFVGVMSAYCFFRYCLFGLTARKGIHCACLGNVIKLPLSTVRLVEDVTKGRHGIVDAGSR